MKRLMLVLLVLGCDISEESNGINYLELCERIEYYCLDKYIDDTDQEIISELGIKCKSDPCLYLIEANQIIANQDTDSIDYIEHDSNSLFFCRTNSMYSIIGTDIIKCHFVTGNQ